jgi:hypothetical protein
MLEGRKRRDEVDYLLDETIVYLLREAKIENDNEMIEEFASIPHAVIVKAAEVLDTGEELERLKNQCKE